MIVLKNINVVFGKKNLNLKHVLKDINLNITKGEFVSIIGSNGAGKSTLLNLLAGNVSPTSGNIKIDNKDISKQSVNKRAGYIARVFQDPLMGTCPNLTLIENLAIARQRGKGINFKSSLTKADVIYFKEILKSLKFGLENRLEQPISSFSGGQRQAISLIMASLADLKLLLLDEPTSALDPKSSQLIMQLSDKIIKEKNLTTIMITHSLNHALNYGTRTIMLHDGKIIHDLNNEQRKSLNAKDLLNKFEEAMGFDNLSI